MTYFEFEKGEARPPPFQLIFSELAVSVAHAYPTLEPIKAKFCMKSSVSNFIFIDA